MVRNKAAEICEKYLNKGDKVYVEGRLKNRQWQGEDGNTRYTTEVHVQDFTFLTTKNESGANAQQPQQKTNIQPISNTPAATTSAPTPAQNVDEDDDLPF